MKSELEYISLNMLEASTNNARTSQIKDADEWAEFVADIKARGLIEPLVVRKLENGGFRVLAGNRRFAALQELYSDKEGKVKASTPSVPCHVMDITEAIDELILSSTENLHRLNLTPLEYAEVVKKLEKMGLRDAQIAERLNKSKTWVSLVKKGKAWGELRKVSTSKAKPPSGPREFDDTDCPICGGLLGVSLVEGSIILEPKGDNEHHHKGGKSKK